MEAQEAGQGFAERTVLELENCAGVTQEVPIAEAIKIAHPFCVAQHAQRLIDAFSYANLEIVELKLFKVAPCVCL